MTSARRRVAIAFVVALLAALVAAPPVSAARRPRNPAPCSKGYVNLSFDDGPTTSTPALLTALRRANLRATFFNVGQWTERYPDYVRQEHTAGHQIGNHTYDHTDLTTLSPTDRLAQLTRTQGILQALTGYAPTFMRPPYGAINDDVRATTDAVGLTPIIWTVDTVDWSGVSTKSIVSAALSVQSGGFVLMHDGYTNTINALPAIATGLAEKGLCAGRIVRSDTPTHAWEGLDFNATVAPW